MKQEQLDIDRIKKKLIIVFSFSIVFLFILLIISTYFIQRDRLHILDKNFQNSINKAIDHTFEHLDSGYLNLLKRMLITTELPKQLYTKERETMYNELKQKLDLLKKENSDIVTLHVHNKDGTSFLRAHAKNDFGDTVSTFRPMLQDIHTNHKVTMGYERGIDANLFRILVPIFYKNEYIGAIELGIAPEFIIKKVNEITGISGLLFVKEDKYDKHKSKSDILIQDFRLLYGDSNTKNILLNNNLDLFKNGETINFENKTYMIYINNLTDNRDNIKAKLVFFHDITFMENARVSMLSMFIVSTLLILAGIIVLINRYINLFQKRLTTIFNKYTIDIEFKNNYLSTVLDSSENIILTTYDNKINTANKKFLDFFKISTLDQFLDKHDCICELFEKDINYLQKNTDGTSWIEYISKNNTEIHKAKIINENKEYIFSVKGHKLDIDYKKRFVATFTDITQIEQQNIILQKLNFIIDNATISIAIINTELEVEYINQYFTFLTGFKKDEVLGKNIKMLERSENTSLNYLNIWERVSKKKTWHGILSNKKKSGEEYKESVMIIPILNDEKILTNYLFLSNDITKELKLKDELKDNEELMISQSRSAAMGEMISMIAHQWKQPLSILSMIANNMKADYDLDDFKIENINNYYNEISEQIQHLAKTIDDFKDFFKPNKEKVLVDISSIIYDSLKIIGKSLENNNIEIVLDLNETRKLETYPNEFIHVMINIIKNAKDVLMQREIKDKEIHISTKSNNNFIIEIEDNAGGIPDDIIDKIFDPYFTTKDELNGTGIGLYMTKTIIENHFKGKIKVENTKLGAKFTIILPII
ncbi:MAG: ATP-binding protein [Campylobacterota bacterium]|nr:ATP-binding protein [Campylobacterota bacterium]